MNELVYALRTTEGSYFSNVTINNWDLTPHIGEATMFTALSTAIAMADIVRRDLADGYEATYWRDRGVIPSPILVAITKRQLGESVIWTEDYIIGEQVTNAPTSNTITSETRREAYERAMETAQLRKSIIVRELSSLTEPITAGLLAKTMYDKGLVPSSDRNNVHPRLTELVKEGRVAVLGKIICPTSGRKCATYTLTDCNNEGGTI